MKPSTGFEDKIFNVQFFENNVFDQWRNGSVKMVYKLKNVVCSIKMFVESVMSLIKLSCVL